MKYENIKAYPDGKFRRITGVNHATYAKMIEILQSAESGRRSRGGPKPGLSVEDQLLATLEYLREYRTYAHIAAGYGLSESQIFRIIRWVEDTLIKDGTFSLPGRKELLKSDFEYEIVVVDTTETPIEKPRHKQRRYYSGKKNGTQ